MTREEREDAIDIIQSILDKYEEDECLVTDIGIGDEDIKAFNMAIKALEQEVVAENTTSDCISRKEAIKCLECDFDITGRANMEVVVNYINSAHDKIMNLPSVKQEPKTDVLSKIRAEISKMQTYLCCHGDTKKVELSEVLELIDKAIKEVGNEQTN